MAIFEAASSAYTPATNVFPRNLLILFCCLLFIEIVILFMGRRKMFYPSLVWVGMFTISTGISFWYSQKLKTDISLNTVYVLLILNLAFVMGDVLFRFFYRACIKPQPEKPSYIEIPNRFRPQWWLILIIIGFAGITYWQYKTEMTMVVQYYKQTPTDFRNFLSLARAMATSNKLDLPLYLNQLLALEKCFCFVLVFGFVFNILFYGFRLTDLLLLVPFPIYVFSSILTTGRTDLIFLFCVCLFSTYFLVQKRFNYSFLSTSILLLFVALAGVAFVYFFFFAAFGKYGTTANKTATFFQYSGGAINAFDVFVNSEQTTTTIFGQHTLYSLYSLLSKLGFAAPLLPNSSLSPVSFFGIFTNIFTVYARWILDFGYFGSIAFTFFWGLLYSCLFCVLEAKERIGFFSIALAYLIYPLVFCSIEDGFFITYSFNLLYCLIYLTMAWLLFVRPSATNRFYFGRSHRATENAGLIEL